MEEMIKFDLHVHTAEISPCGRVPAAEMVRRYHEAGYAGCFITDHLSRYGLPEDIDKPWPQVVEAFLRGYELARAEGDRLGFKVFMGAELCFDSGPEDFLLLGIDRQFLLDHPRLNRSKLSKVKAMMNRAGLALYQCHPLRDRLKLQPAQDLDGLEVYNGNPRHDSRNDRVLAIARERGCLMISGSDAHQVEDIARGGVLVPAQAACDGRTLARYLIEHNDQLHLLRT